MRLIAFALLSIPIGASNLRAAPEDGIATHKSPEELKRVIALIAGISLPSSRQDTKRVIPRPAGIAMRSSPKEAELRSLSTSLPISMPKDAVAKLSLTERFLASCAPGTFIESSSSSPEYATTGAAWMNVAFGKGIFVAVASNDAEYSSPDQVMTSADSETWTKRTAPTNNWNVVGFGNNLFVALAHVASDTSCSGTTGSGQCAMTSPDGSTWTLRSTPAMNLWTAVAYGNSVFVAVSGEDDESGTCGDVTGGQCAMTSTDGITWTLRTTGVDFFSSIAFSGSMFAATSAYGHLYITTNGIDWTFKMPDRGYYNIWTSVTYGDGKFVAVAYATDAVASTTCGGNSASLGSSGECAMVSSDNGASWVLESTPTGSDNAWVDVTYGNSLFVAVSNTGLGSCGGDTDGQCMMARGAADGFTWIAAGTIQPSPTLDLEWNSITFGNDIFTSVAGTSSSTSALLRVMKTVLACGNCPAGTFLATADQVTEDACQSCPTGKVSPSGSSSCLTSCPAGTYSSGSQMCSSCAAGRYSSGSTVCSDCPAGTYTSNMITCVGCGAGTYSTTTGASSAGSCMSCAAGRYAASTGATSCSACPAGTGTSDYITCVSCATGKFYDSGSLLCSSCAAGKYTASTGSTACSSCPAGTYTSDMITCVGCGAGTFSATAEASSAGSCVSCPINTYSATSGSTACTTCPDGGYTVISGASSSSSCAVVTTSAAAGCFSGLDTVNLEGGGLKVLSEVRVGDRILTSDAAGALTFSDVVFLPHGFNDDLSNFIEITTAEGNVVKMTGKHLVKTCSGELTYAENIQATECVKSATGGSRIASVSRVQARGMYTVVTTNEFVVVGGIIASPFSFNHNIVHAYYNIHRAVYKVVPAAMETKALAMTNAVIGAVAVFAADATISK